MARASLPRSFYQIRDYAQRNCKTITMGELMRTTGSDPASLITRANFLRDQLPVRLARRIEDILKLPHVVVSNPHISSVLSSYVETFETLQEIPEIESVEDEAKFLRVIREQAYNHNPGTRLVAEGYRQVRRMYPEIQLDKFMHDHFTTRIATRILMDNYSEMRTPQDGFVGVVCQGMRPLGIVQEIVSEISDLTSSIYGCAPDVEYRGNVDCDLDYIPRHVKYMVREILKNAFRSTVERHKSRSSVSDNSHDIPPVVIELQQGDIHVIIKISDQGGGMSKTIQQEAWQYGWTTVAANGDRPEAGLYAEESCSWDRNRGTQEKKGRLKSELAGYGFGLPLTRLHAQYFGGDVFLQALPGHGTDMYLLLTHLKEGTPSTEIDDLSTILYQQENSSVSAP